MRPSMPEKPNARPVWVILGVPVAFVFLAIYGLWIGIVPTDLDVDVGYAGALFGAAMGAWIASRMEDKILPGTGLDSPILRYPLYILLLAAISYLAIGRGLPSLYTTVLGRPGERIVTVAFWGAGGARVCPGPQLVEEPFVSEAICVRSAPEIYEGPGARLLVSGKTSPFGIRVDRVQPYEQPGTAHSGGSVSSAERALKELSP